MEDNIKSPYVPEAQTTEEPKFDFNALRDQTSGEAIKAIWKMFGENADKFTCKAVPTEEDAKIFNDSANFLEERIVEILIQHKVPNKDLEWLVENMIGFLVFVFSILKKRKEGMDKEFLSRTIGVRNPEAKNFDYGFATLEDTMKALVEIREKNADNGADY